MCAKFLNFYLGKSSIQMKTHMWWHAWYYLSSATEEIKWPVLSFCNKMHFSKLHSKISLLKGYGVTLHEHMLEAFWSGVLLCMGWSFMNLYDGTLCIMAVSAVAYAATPSLLWLRAWYQGAFIFGTSIFFLSLPSLFLRPLKDFSTPNSWMKRGQRCSH